MIHRLAFCCLWASVILTTAKLNGQIGSACSIPIEVTEDQCFEQLSIDAGQKWFSFTATYDAEVIKIVNSSDPLKKHIHKVYVFNGCGQLLRSDQMQSGTDEQLDIVLFALIPGNQYSVQIVNDENPGCTKCGIDNNSFFDICFSAAPSGTLSGCSTSYCSDPCNNENLFNGGFEQGPIGFGSTAVYHACSQIGSPPPYVYGVCSDASQLNGSWNGLPHSGTSSFFIDDPETPPPGNTVSVNAAAWYVTIPVVSNQWYCISFWTRNIVDVGFGTILPEVVLNVDGNNTFDQYNVATSGSMPNGGGWQQVCYSWYSNSNTSVGIWIGSIPNGSSGSGNDYALDDISIKGITAPPTISASSITSCTNSPATLTANSTSQPPNVSYLWMPGGQTTSTITVNPIVPTTYTVTVTDGCANAYSSTITITPVNALPSFTYSQISPCVNGPVNFTNTSNTFNVQSTYKWYFGDNTTSTVFSPSHTYSSPGSYSVTLEITNSCGVFTTTQVVNVIPSSATYNPNCCSETFNYTLDETQIGPIIVGGPLSNPVHWTPANGTIYIRGNVNIFPGTALIIDPGTIVEFDPLSKIVVSRGAVLTVNGATLKGLSVCGTMWQGIEVWGDKTKSESQIQFPATGQLYQGKVILTNAIIRDAHNGVVAGRRGNANFDANFGGGIILASNTQFLNCGYSVRLTPYPLFVSHTRITSCTFNSTTLLDPGYSSFNSYTYPNANNQFYAYANQAQRAYTYVQTIGVKFTLIGDNSFNNSEYGIVGINSSLRVIDWDQDLTGNVFSNINNGEVHGNIFNSPFYANRIEKNEYISTVIPIQSWSGLGDRILDNDIPSGAFIGIGSVSSKAITINDNRIGGTGGGCLIGVSSSNTGAMGGLIGYSNFGNTFTNCVNGVGTGGNNGFLQIHCNTHNNNNTYLRNWWNTGPLAHQGTLPVLSDKDAAGNGFFPFTPAPLNQIYSTTLFDYHSHNFDIASGTTDVVIPTPSLISGNVLTGSNFIVEPFARSNTSCDPGPPCTNCNPQMLILDQEIEDLEAEKQAVVVMLDGGQTQVLLDAINSNMSGGELKNLLLGNSPLSDEVLLAYIAKNGTPPGLFNDVLVQNSPVSATVRPALYAKIVSMPNGIQNQIIAAQSSLNRTLSVVDGELQSKIGQRQQVYNQQMTVYVDLSETDTLVEDSVYQLLERQNTYAATSALASAYLAGEYYTEALTTINSLSAANVEEQAEKDMLLLLHGIHSSGRDVFAMTIAEEQQVRSTAAMPEDCPARANARVILFIVFGEPLIIDINNNARLAGPDPLVVKADIFLGESYPNPAGGQVNMECSIPEGSTAILKVYDVNGKVIYSQAVNDDTRILSLETSSWSSGVYLSILETETGVIREQKIVISNPE